MAGVGGKSFSGIREVLTGLQLAGGGFKGSRLLTDGVCGTNGSGLCLRGYLMALEGSLDAG